jgi:hypothetical protein
MFNISENLVYIKDNRKGVRFNEQRAGELTRGINSLAFSFLFVQSSLSPFFFHSFFSLVSARCRDGPTANGMPQLRVDDVLAREGESGPSLAVGPDSESARRSRTRNLGHGW